MSPHEATEKDEAKAHYKPADHMHVGSECCHDVENDRHTQYLVEQDLMGAVYWSGNCFKDYCFFLANWHPLLSMFMSHPKHPYSKFERMFTFFVGCALTMLPSALLVKGVTYTQTKAAETIYVVGTVATTAAPYEGGHVSTAVVLLFITLPVMIIEICLYQVAVVDAYCEDQDEKGHHPICSCLKGCVHAIRGCCFCFSGCFAVTIGSLSMLVLYLNDLPFRDITDPFMQSRIQSWILWLPLHLLLPCTGFLHRWCQEKKDHEEGHGHSETESDE